MYCSELYNEVVTDMLAASKDGEAPALRVLEDPERGGPRVEGLSEVVVMGEEHVEELFKRVEACRHVGFSACHRVAMQTGMC